MKRGTLTQKHADVSHMSTRPRRLMVGLVRKGWHRRLGMRIDQGRNRVFPNTSLDVLDNFDKIIKPNLRLTISFGSFSPVF